MKEQILYPTERGLSSLGVQGIKPAEDSTTKNIIKQYFGFDYEPVVMNRLEHWDSLPKGHKLKFFDIPQTHNGSKGLYLAEEIVGSNWVFVQAMFKDGISTKHKHGENVIELYDPLAGKSTLMVDDKDHELNPGAPFEVFSGQVHQLKTPEGPSLNLLIMKNSAHIPRNMLHVPVI